MDRGSGLPPRLARGIVRRRAAAGRTVSERMNFIANKDISDEDLAKGAAIGVVTSETVAKPATPPERPRVNLRPLASLIPYVKRYRWRVFAALIALTVAAVTTLLLPVAVRRMIDFGFSERGLTLIDNYFLAMIGVAAVLALASASRYFLVTTLGERIVADLRGDVFAHLSALSAVFFDEAKTGEVISRLTADTTQIK